MADLATRYKRITAVYAAFSLASVIPSAVFAVYLAQKGLDPVILGIILSSFSFGSIFIAPIIGSISDNMGRKPVILAGIALEALATLMYLLGTDAITIFLARLLDALGYFAVVLVAIAKLEDLLSDSDHKSEQVGKSLSIAQIGHVVGPLIGGVLADAFFIELPFLSTIFMLVVLFWVYSAIPKTAPPQPPLLRLTFNPIPALRQFLSERVFRGLAALGMAHQSVVPAFLIFIPIHLIQDLHLSFTHVGVALFVQAIPMLFQFYGGKLSDKLGSRKVTFIGSGFTCLALFGIAFAPSFEWLLVALLVHGLGTSLWNVSALSYLSQFGEKNKQEATYLGSFISLSKVGAFIAFLLSGFIVQAHGFSALFQVIGLTLGFGITYALGADEVRHRFVEPPINVMRNFIHWR
ncbi:MAG: MFS transporter [Candidatus Iainarchaeum archaeon]|uniref:MFS transporter n=1 Tax=Candidatus Iainarchaeum sp. TaxID=3101447 RepID=A0A7T9DJI2_9ARCH|nr:MAG: MFS transporter [Candidatus Diapherotrites archaeon]